jgi:cardiolipin synthase A/B
MTCVHEDIRGLLHTKSMTADDDIALIGSANMDRRSFDLNYENNILLFDRSLSGELQIRLRAYLEWPSYARFGPNSGPW